ncbi:MAG: PQQ-binding-like beta-propeller repeat protein [bacterium]|nr:PQQ-binding-like beta-propeller repeat protein [bacterium]
MNGWTRRACVAVLILALALPAALGAEPAESWTRWGGPSQDFKAPGEGIAASWGEAGPKTLWSRELGDGYSTILVEDGRLYTMYRAGDEEAVICMKADSGETIWEKRYDHDPHENHAVQFGIGPRATPLIAGDRIYTIGVAGRMHSMSKADGEIHWSHDLWGEEFGGNLLPHGYSSSPIEYKDTVIALVGGEGKSIVAFDKKDGSVAWQSMSYKNSYSTPQILEVDGQEQLVAFMAKELIGVDPGSGEELWRYAQENQFEQNINNPALVDGQYLFLSSPQAGARGLKLTRGEDGKTQVEELWSTRKIQFYHVTSVQKGDYVYGSSGMRSPAFMSAVNVKTGEIPWRKRGFAKANSVYADGRVIVLDEEGKLYLTTATPEDLTVHSEVELLERVAWSAPTIVGKNMYVRDMVKIMALDLSTSASPKMADASPKEANTAEAEPAEAEPAEAEPAEQMAEAGEKDSEAVAILKKVDAAVKAVKGIRFEGYTKPTGVALNFRSPAEGGGVMYGWNGQGPETFYGHVKTTRQGSGEPLELTGGSDSETYFLIDHGAKKAYEDMDPGVMGTSGQALASLGMREFVHPTPFDDEINAQSVELQGKEEVAGVECYKIHVDYGRGGQMSTWFFSTEDMLPRRRVQHFAIPDQGEGSFEITLTKLEVDPEVTPETYRMKLPEGYEKVDDFAP